MYILQNTPKKHENSYIWPSHTTVNAHDKAFVGKSEGHIYTCQVWSDRNTYRAA